jgi:hypothetical protein
MILGYYNYPETCLVALKIFKNKGLHNDFFQIFAKQAGFLAVDFDPKTPWDYESLSKELKSHGPLWCAGKFTPSGRLHVIVLRGVSEEKVFINDPSGPKRLIWSLNWFNKNLNKYAKCCMLYKPKTKPKRPTGPKIKKSG